MPIAKWVRKKYPDHRIIVAADDDWKEDGNPGISKAHDAAREVEGLVAVPEFGDKRGEKDTDFNDIMIALGLEANRCSTTPLRLMRTRTKRKTTPRRSPTNKRWFFSS